MTNKTIPSTEVIILKEAEILRLGSSYSSEVFYQYKSAIASTECSLSLRDGRLVVRHLTTEDIPKTSKVMEYGEDMYLEGLCILFLGRYLVLYALYGQLRINCRNRRL